MVHVEVFKVAEAPTGVDVVFLEPIVNNFGRGAVVPSVDDVGGFEAHYSALVGFDSRGLRFGDEADFDEALDGFSDECFWISLSDVFPVRGGDFGGDG